MKLRFFVFLGVGFDKSNRYYIVVTLKVVSLSTWTGM